jgi:[acyl-carrier-protein] S-malonyltransferase
MLILPPKKESKSGSKEPENRQNLSFATPSKIAFLFPGQGAQYPGMGKDFADAFSIARETFEEADDLLQEPISRIIFEGPDQELTKTKNSQLAIFIMSAALLRSFQSQFSGVKPHVCAGLSLGEYTALWASGKLSFQETLLLVRYRANFMNEACETVHGTMAAILGMDGSDVESSIKNISGVWVANYNCPGQVVISGTEAAVGEATSVLKLAGAKRVIPLQVHGAFHSGLMQKAQDKLAPCIEQAPLLESDIALAMNAPGDFVGSLSAIRRQLILQVTGSVRWEQLILNIDKREPHQFFEIGCGKTLAGFNKKMGFPTLTVEKIADLEKVAHELGALK